MKFLLLLAVLAVLVASSLALKNEICGLEHSRNGDGRISCETFIPSWSFDSAANECIKFIYGGCGGNANRFDSKAECEAKCLE
ncbi:male accessory gland serine protease inhibitor-like [Drosophila guanche]|uniref:Blast:Male accessory gland serine protease inhibitor n=1 Tax=Drosophila guanche TaxID=7266 RepID=A0A3B0J9Z0_DROGU|nr:male accessory gland serine protease inhibitor-like [Drosophila guanche]SPP79077.1 blast:Male accessory gland serine protease inhibitor [Drosophila guanche]